MKTIGLLGGMSWESTVHYYEIMNETVKEALGGLHSAKILMYSVDFAELEANMACGNWDEDARILGEAAKKLEDAGADFIVIGTNTMHKLVPQIQACVDIPVYHIAEATADVMARCGIKKVALLGTRFTMTEDFYRAVLEKRGFEVMIPDAAGVAEVDRVIFEELCLGIVTEESRKYFLKLIDDLAQMGAEGIILGCTEIGMLVKQEDTEVPIFDTTVIHASGAARMALEK